MEEIAEVTQNESEFSNVDFAELIDSGIKD
jgi:hypothetical protein